MKERRPRVVLVMGVAGSGKTTVGQELATRLGARFLEGDDAHPPKNVEKMRRGVALTDGDRLPWLRRLHGSLAACVARGEDVVLACSALKRSYRKVLLGGEPPLDAEVTILHLTGKPEVIRARLAARAGHFAGPELLDSQLATLQPPPGAITADIETPAHEIVESVVARIEPPVPVRPAGAPDLKSALRRLLLSQPGVVEQRSRFANQLAFHADGKEFAHFHSESVIDVRVPRAHHKALRGDPRVISGRTDWIEFEFRTEEDVETVLRLAQAALDDARARALARPGKKRGR